MTWLQLTSAAALASAALFNSNPPTLSAEDPRPAIASEDLAFHPVEVLDLQTERYNRLTVPVTIMGQGPYRFLIDTGSQATVLSRSLADHLALHDRRSATLVAMNSRRQVETTFVPDMQMGKRSFFVRTAPLLEGVHIGGADGILGLDSLQEQRVLLDFEANSISVASAEELGGNDGFQIVVRAREKLGQLIIARAEVDGVRTAVIIDTGAQGSIGNAALLDRLRRRSRDMGMSEMTDVNGVKTEGNVRVTRMLNMGRAQLQNVAVTFTESPIFEELDLHQEPALVLGMSELRLFERVAIDFAQRRVLFDVPRNERVPSSAAFHSYGVG